MNDTLSLTLPKAGARSRRRRARPPLPPNWRGLLARIVFSAASVLFFLAIFVRDGDAWALAWAAEMAVALAAEVRMWNAGGALPPAEHRRISYALLGLWVLGLVLMAAGA